MLGPELKKPLKRLAARFFQLSLPAVGREQLEAVGGSCPGMLVSPRNSDMFFRRRPGAWSGRVGQGQPGSLWPPGWASLTSSQPGMWEGLCCPAWEAAPPETRTCSGGCNIQTQMHPDHPQPPSHKREAGGEKESHTQMHLEAQLQVDPQCTRMRTASDTHSLTPHVSVLSLSHTHTRTPPPGTRTLCDETHHTGVQSDPEGASYSHRNPIFQKGRLKPQEGTERGPAGLPSKARPRPQP